MAPVSVLPLQAKTAHVQGIDTDGNHLWVTSVDRASRKGFLQEFAVSDGRLERSVEIQDGHRFHPGGIAADVDSIWIPVAEYRAKSTAVIQRRNKRTLALESQYAVDDHIGCIAVTPKFLIGGNWDSRDFYFWEHQGKLIRKVSSTTGNAYQDIKFRDGHVVGSGTLVGGPSRGRLAGSLDRLGPPPRAWEDRPFAALHARRHDVVSRSPLAASGRRR